MISILSDQSMSMMVKNFSFWKVTSVGVGAETIILTYITALSHYEMRNERGGVQRAL